jgi:hypothetical protein
MKSLYEKIKINKRDENKKKNITGHTQKYNAKLSKYKKCIQ